MNPKWQHLAADLLDIASDKFANHGCNDFKKPADWTQAEWDELHKAMHAANGSPQDYEPGNEYGYDWWLMSFMADQLRGAAS